MFTTRDYIIITFSYVFSSYYHKHRNGMAFGGSIITCLKIMADSRMGTLPMKHDIVV